MFGDSTAPVETQIVPAADVAMYFRNCRTSGVSLKAPAKSAPPTTGLSSAALIVGHGKNAIVFPGTSFGFTCCSAMPPTNPPSKYSCAFGLVPKTSPIPPTKLWPSTPWIPFRTYLLLMICTMIFRAAATDGSVNLSLPVKSA